MARSIDPLVVGKVIGDVIDTFVPSVDMAIHYSSRQVTNGCQMKPSATAQAPEIQLSDNSDGNNYYTLIMTDPDAPSPSEPSLREWLHCRNIVGNNYMMKYIRNMMRSLNVTARNIFGIKGSKRSSNRIVTDIPGNSGGSESNSGFSWLQEQATRTSSTGRELVPYMGPRPPIGIHRYAFILFKQPSTPFLISPPAVRNNFSTRNFAAHYGLGLPVAATYCNAQKEPGSRRR